MTKPKRQPKNFFRYFLDEFILFRRDFYFVSDADPNMLVNELDELHCRQKMGLLFNPSRTTISVEIIDESLYFNLYSEQMTKGGGYEKSAKATGSAYINNEKVILEGTIVMGGRDYWGANFAGLIIPVLGLGLLLHDSPNWNWNLWIGISIFSIVFFWFQAYQDRNHLYKLIQSVVESANGNNNKTQAS